jgi:t-SNARE complex subunit (syntaxin)
MSKLATKSAKAQQNIDTLESALDRTQQALKAAEKADLAATAVTKKSRKLFKLLLILTVIGVAVVVVKKFTGGSSTPPGNPDPYGSDSTEK